MNTITLTGESALFAKRAIAEVRDTFPILNKLTDGEILEIIVSHALEMEVPA